MPKAFPPVRENAGETQAVDAGAGKAAVDRIYYQFNIMKNSSTQRPTARQLIMLAFLFLISSVGAWAWFHVNPRVHPSSLHFELQTNITGFAFTPETVSAEAIEILSTTNLFNGNYTRERRDRFTVFAGEWIGKDAREMSVVQHTPDICWIGAGAKPVNMGQPETVDIDLNGVKTTFECRVFKLADNAPPELTLWCALVSGQIITEGGRFTGNTDDEWKRKSLLMRFNRIRAMNMFLFAIRNRIASDGLKQFVRLSTSVDRDWKSTLERLQSFTKKWLEVKMTRVANTTLPPIVP